MKQTKDLNPLDVLETRQVGFLPEHFVYSNHQITHKENLVKTWIYENTKGRFYMNQNVALDGDNRFVYTVCVGFENSLEQTLFIMACPHIHK